MPRAARAHFTDHGVRTAAVGLVVAYVALTAVWTGLGLLVTGPLAGTWVMEVDQDIAVWFVEIRTPMWTDVSAIGSMLADTMVKVVVTAIIAGVMLAVWRSWRAPFLIVFSLVLEASVFITTTWFVARHRPDVVRLDGTPVDTSFPSGHAAAATAYGAIAVVVFNHTRNVAVRTITVIVVGAVSVIVSIARLYRGMHYLTDVIAGVALGVAAIYAVVVVARRSFEWRPEPDRELYS